MKRFSGTALNEYKSIELVSKPDSGWYPGIRYQNPFTEDPYRQLTTIKDLCRFWSEETRIRSVELDKYRKENG